MREKKGTEMNIQEQLNELKATLEAIRQSIAMIEHQLDGGCTEKEGCECVNCTAARADFNAWADDYNRRHPRTECPLCCKPLYGSDRLFHKECADREQMEADAWGDPSMNNHPASWGKS